MQTIYKSNYHQVIDKICHLLRKRRLPHAPFLPRLAPGIAGSGSILGNTAKAAAIQSATTRSKSDFQTNRDKYTSTIKGT